MKRPQPSEPSLSPDEVFVDAALREKVRLGDAIHDETLVRNILLETVEKPIRTAFQQQDSREQRRFWFTAVGAAAALIALLTAVLATLPFRKDRFEEEVLFIVQHGSDPSPAEVEPTRDVRKPVPSRSAPTAVPFLGELSLNQPAAPPETTLSESAGNLELTTIFGQSISEFAPRAVRRESFRILADRTSFTETEKVYSGNVILRYAGYEISASEVRVARGMNGNDPNGDPPSPQGRVSAREVTVYQTEPIRIIVADLLEFDPLDGSIALSGIRKLESPSDSPVEPGDSLRIVLRDRGMVVENEGETIKYANPLPKKLKSK